MHTDLFLWGRLAYVCLHYFLNDFAAEEAKEEATADVNTHTLRFLPPLLQSQ